MGHVSYADEIAATKVMLAGLKANTERLSKRGVDAEFISELEEDYTQSLTLDNDQEALKARLKETTAALDGWVDKMRRKRSEARKLVKLEMPKESWKEFGINDKR